MASKTKLDKEREILVTVWKECRETVRNFDRTLTSLRIYSLVFAGALMGISTTFFMNDRIDAAVITAGATIALIAVVGFLERHYRGFLVTTSDTAIELEKMIRENVHKEIGIDLCQNTMISWVIKQRRESYGWFMKNAHVLMYVFLGAANFALIVFFLALAR